MDAAAFLALAVTCAPQVAPDTLTAIARHESALSPWLVHDNTSGESLAPRDAEAAIAEARRRIAAGRSVDMGLMQINSGNLGWLGLTVEAVFEPCANVAAGGRVLMKAYEAAAEKVGPGPEALRAALSLYNTGDRQAGFRNGYVGQVENKATAYVVPPLTRQGAEASAVVPVRVVKAAPAQAQARPSESSADPFGAGRKADPFNQSAASVLFARGQ
ncbi:type IV secretion system protein VirB1 [Enhydrobacter aerosaccus]|uniref:Type IV secretion system protein VirB1 n=1 Tax=Enhydrobacter aerosaccus TaxID=225324 RepID=A0A1T4TIU5_9HYPH|nr:lytic transglycosylase domain-containing protein [Enhydrobacter aerosaccus]SKA40372.1 type IV secretion system protein VirB1 [Enhydrobacter aerosaccus]